MMAKTKSWMVHAALASAMVVGGAAALAAPPNATERQEITALQSASISPTAAVEAAESHTNGRALVFGFEVNRNTNAYEVTVQTPTGLRLVQVNPSTGAVAGSKVVNASALAEDGLPASALRHASAAPGSLAAAVAAAEQAAGGRALEANYSLRNGQWVVAVDVPMDGKIHSFRVNPADGTVRQAARTEQEKPEGHEPGESR
ncbi:MULTISPECIES: PepSY domain-containing protein [Roseicella]|nr:MULTISPECIES: PepSY domain-containing protein [Roseicella]